MLKRDKDCTLCKLHKTAEYVCLLGQGPEPCEVMIVGEAPGRREDDSGKPFVGKSGQLLESILEAKGLKRKKVFITNAVSCRPPGNRTPTKAEIRSCKRWLDYQMAMIKPKYVLLLGGVAYQSVTGKAGISKARGKPFEMDGRVYLPTFHPSFALRDPANEKVIEEDVDLFTQIIEFGGIPRERDLNYTIVRTQRDVDRMLDALEGVVSFDLETTGLYPWANDFVISTLGFGTETGEFILPMNGHPTEEVWSDDGLDEILERIEERLDDCIVVTQNGKFDFLCLWVEYGFNWVDHHDFDTMLAHYSLDENSRHDLEWLAQLYCGAPNWDVDLKTKQGFNGIEKQALYQAHDLFYTRKLRGILLKKLKQDPEVKLVFDKILMPCARLFTEIEFDGLYLDLEQFEAAEKYLRREFAKAETELDKFGRINWGSSQQVGRLLFQELGLDIIERTKGGAPSTNESVIKRLDHPCADALLRYKAAKQQLSFFIDGWKPFIHESKLHPSFKLHGAVTGRLSSEHPNAQQIPRDSLIRSLITAPPGWTLVECDLSQIELRIAAELANERTMLQAFADGQDVHWITCLRELERGGGGPNKDLMYETAELCLMRFGLSPDRTGAKILLALWDATKKGAFTPQLLQMESEEWANQKTRDREWRQSKKRIESLLERWGSNLGTKVPEELLPAMREYTKFVSSSPKQKSDGQSKIQFGDVVSILSCVGPSVAQEFSEDWKELRKKAKAVGFGYLFGMWYKKFKTYARDNYGVNVSDKEAKASYNFFFNTYNFKPWHKRQQAFAREHGYVRSLSGRKRRLPRAKDPEDTPERREALRQAINSPVQSFANEINLMAALQLRQEFGRNIVKICATVHDAILMRVKDTHVKQVTRRLLKIMRRPDLFDTFEITLKVPIEAEAKVGPWSKGVSLKKWEETNEQSIR